jgi:DNA-binding transcriptional regulator YdaS (Cro superfamily)
MQLQEWLDNERITYTDFAKRVGTKHARTVERYAKGARHPRPAMMAAIRRETGGKVTADDFQPITAE